MIKKKAPAFQLYAGDLMSDQKFILMNLEERGAYLTLLCSAWLDGGIPDDIPKLARICGVGPEKMAEIWPALKPCFPIKIETKNGEKVSLLSNKRLEAERKKRDKFIKEQSKKAKKRWGKADNNKKDTCHGNAKGGNATAKGDATAMPRQYPRGQCSSSSSSSSEDLLTNQCPETRYGPEGQLEPRGDIDDRKSDREQPNSRKSHPPPNVDAEDIKTRVWQIQADLELSDEDEKGLEYLIRNYWNNINPAIAAVKDRNYEARQGRAEPLQNVMAYFRTCVTKEIPENDT